MNQVEFMNGFRSIEADYDDLNSELIPLQQLNCIKSISNA